MLQCLPSSSGVDPVIGHPARAWGGKVRWASHLPPAHQLHASECEGRKKDIRALRDGKCGCSSLAASIHLFELSKEFIGRSDASMVNHKAGMRSAGREKVFQARMVGDPSRISGVQELGRCVGSFIIFQTNDWLGGCESDSDA